MLNVLGGVQVYTVPEVDALLSRTGGFVIVDKLPPISGASAGVTYYKKASQLVHELKGYRRPDDPDGDETADISDEPTEEYSVPVYIDRPTFFAYAVGYDDHMRRVWYTSGERANESMPMSEEEIMTIWNKYNCRYRTLKTQHHLALLDMTNE